MKLTELASVQQSIPIDTLSKTQLKTLQKALSLLGYPVGVAHGLIGPKTRSAWAEFANKELQSQPDRIIDLPLCILAGKGRRTCDTARCDQR